MYVPIYDVYVTFRRRRQADTVFQRPEHREQPVFALLGARTYLCEYSTSANVQQTPPGHGGEWRAARRRRRYCCRVEYSVSPHLYLVGTVVQGVVNGRTGRNGAPTTKAPLWSWFRLRFGMSPQIADRMHIGYISTPLR